MQKKADVKIFLQNSFDSKTKRGLIGRNVKLRLVLPTGQSLVICKNNAIFVLFWFILPYNFFYNTLNVLCVIVEHKPKCRGST